MPLITAVMPRMGAMPQMSTVTLTAQLSRRKSVYDLTDLEVNDLRKAVRGLAQLNDDRGYQHIAGIHGYPLPIYCTHGTPLFAVWHRPYLLLMEKALQAIVQTVSLPYWDWTSERALAEGIPNIYSDSTYADPETKEEIANPLFSQPISFTGSRFDKTFRAPAAAAKLGALLSPVDVARRSPDYVSHSRNLENPHNAIHEWAGGTMAMIPYAAYDPLFWAHHANVDRIFVQWQSLNPGVAPPPEVLQAVLPPFNVVVSDIWNIANLGYEYVVTPTVVAGTPSLLAEGPEMPPTVVFPLVNVRRRFARAELHFDGVAHPEDSFEVRVFANTTDASSDTPIEDNPKYCGSLYLFGHGICGGDAGHCDVPAITDRDVFDIRPQHHLTPMHLVLDVQDTVAWLLEQKEATFTVCLIVVDKDGKAIGNDLFTFDSMTFVAD